MNQGSVNYNLWYWFSKLTITVQWSCTCHVMSCTETTATCITKLPHALGKILLYNGLNNCRQTFCILHLYIDLHIYDTNLFHHCNWWQLPHSIHGSTHMYYVFMRLCKRLHYVRILAVTILCKQLVYWSVCILEICWLNLVIELNDVNIAST